MKKTEKTWTAVLLALIMALSALPVLAHASEAGFEDSACVIGLSAFYDDLPTAVNAAEDGEVITVLRNLGNQSGLRVSGKSIIINGAGSNIGIDDFYGILVENGGSLTFTNGYMTIGADAYGVYARTGGKVDIWGTVVGMNAGVYATGEGSSVKINGVVQNWGQYSTSLDFLGIGAYAGDNASVVVTGRETPLTGVNYGAFAETGGYIRYDGSVAEGENRTGAHAESGGKIDITGNYSRFGAGVGGGAAFGKIVGAYADGKGSVVNVANNAAGGFDAGGIGAWARNGGVINTKFATGNVGVRVDQTLEVTDLLQPLNYYTMVKVESGINISKFAGIENSTGIVNIGGVVILEGYINKSVGTYISMGDQTTLGTSEKEFEESDSMDPPARFATEYPKTNYNWYYNDGPLSHSFTIIRTEGYPCGIGDQRFEGFRSAMDAVQNGQTITLYKNCIDLDLYDLAEKNITIDLNRNNLDISGLIRINNNSAITIKGEGKLTIGGGLTVGTGSKFIANDPDTVLSAEVSVTNGTVIVPDAIRVEAGAGAIVTVSGDVTNGVLATNGGKVTVQGSVTGGEYAVKATGKGSAITVNGSVVATADDSTAVIAENQGKVTVKGNATAKKTGVSAVERELTLQGSWNMDDGASATVGGVITSAQTGAIIEGGRVMAESGINAPIFAVIPALKDIESRPDKVLYSTDDLNWNWTFWDDNYVGEYGTYNKYYYIEYQHTDAYGNPLMDPQYLDADGNPLINNLHSHLLVNTIPQENVVVQGGNGRLYNDFAQAMKALNIEMNAQVAANAGKPDDEKTRLDTSITLNRNVTYAVGLVLEDTSLTVETNGFYLEISGVGISMKNSELKSTGDGEIRALGGETGIRLFNNSKATIDSAVSVTGTGAYVSGGSSLTVKGDVTGYLRGIEITDKGSTATVGNVIVENYVDGVGAYVTREGNLTVNGDVKGGLIGVSAEDQLDTTLGLTVPGGKITVHWNVKGAKYGAVAIGDGSEITVGGNVLATNIISTGAIADEKGKITIAGSAQGGDYGAVATGGGSVSLGGGASGSEGGAYADGKGSKVTVSGPVFGTGVTSFGAQAKNAGSVTVGNGAYGGMFGVVADGVVIDIDNPAGVRSKVTMTGDCIALLPGGIGAQAINGGTVSVENGTVKGSAWGLFAIGTGSKVNVAGNIVSAKGLGADVRDGAVVEITGNVSGLLTGVQALGTGTKVTVGGNVTATDSDDGHGLDVRNAATVIVAGNVTSGFLGVNAENLSSATIDGILNAGDSTLYIVLDGWPHTSAQFTTPTDKTGYLTYRNDHPTSTVYVKNFALPPTITTNSLTNGTVGSVYAQSLTAMGDAPIIWTHESGTLPNGLNLSPEGLIYGKPAAAGTFNFTVRASNGTAPDATKTLSIVVDSGYTFALAATGPWGAFAKYNTIDEVLAFVRSVDAPGPIEFKLLQDYECSSVNMVREKLILDLNGHTMNVTNPAGTGLTASKGAVLLIKGEGALNISGSTYGVNSIGAEVEVTNVTLIASSSNSNAVFCQSALGFTSTGTLRMEEGIVRVKGSVLDNRPAGNISYAVMTGYQGNIVIYGDVHASSGALQTTAADEAILVKGNVYSGANGVNKYAVDAGAGSSITIEGDLFGAGSLVQIYDANVSVKGNITSSSPIGSTGVYIYGASSTNGVCMVGGAIRGTENYIILGTAKVSAAEGVLGGDPSYPLWYYYSHPGHSGKVYAKDQPGNFVPVTDIETPVAAMVGIPLILKGTVIPANANNQTIQWSVKDAGTTDAVIRDGTLYTTTTGTVLLNAMITGGTDAYADYSKDFTLTVYAPIVQVKDITHAPRSAVAGVPLTLTGTVQPSDATYKIIEWSVKDAGTTGAAIDNGVLTASSAGTITITATVANGIPLGMAYTQDFVLKVYPEGTAYVCEVDGVGFVSLEDALDEACARNVNKTIKLLQDINYNKEIVIPGSLGSQTIITIDVGPYTLNVDSSGDPNYRYGMSFAYYGNSISLLSSGGEFNICGREAGIYISNDNFYFLEVSNVRSTEGAALLLDSVGTLHVYGNVIGHTEGIYFKSYFKGNFSDVITVDGDVISDGSGLIIGYTGWPGGSAGITVDIKGSVYAKEGYGVFCYHGNRVNVHGDVINDWDYLSSSGYWEDGFVIFAVDHAQVIVNGNVINKSSAGAGIFNDSVYPIVIDGKLKVNPASAYYFFRFVNLAMLGEPVSIYWGYTTVEAYDPDMPDAPYFTYTLKNSGAYYESNRYDRKLLVVQPFDEFIPAEDIINVPDRAAVGVTRVLTGTVLPAHSTNKFIEWSVKDAGTTGAVIEKNLLDASAPGKVIVTATILDGLAPGVPFVKNFEITAAAFTPVEDVTGVPGTLPARTPLDLSVIASVSPTGATYKTALWSVKDAGTTGAAINSDILTTTASGTVKLTVTIKDGIYYGVDYSKDFDILIETNNDVCMIVETNVKYGSLQDALAAVSTDQTIRLLNNVTHTNFIFIYDKTVKLELGNYDLLLDTSASTSSSYALEVARAHLILVGGGTGEFNIKAGINGVYVAADPPRSTASAMVNNVETTNTANDNIAVNLFNGGKITVNGDVKATGRNGTAIMLSAGNGCEAIINGDITSTRTGINGSGAFIVNVSGSILVTGTGSGVFIVSTGNIFVGRDVVSVGQGGWVTAGGEVTIDGYLYVANPYLSLGTYSTVNLTINDITEPTTKEGYRTYNSGDATVWVKDAGVPQLDRIAVAYHPNKGTYAPGETLNLTGMVITAIYDYGISKTVTGHTTYPAAGTSLVDPGDNIITVTYSENGVTRSVNFTVTVSATPVCEIVGKTQYYTIDSAVTASANGDTIRLLTDITHNGEVAVLTAKRVNLELGNYNLNIDTSLTQSTRGLRVASSGGAIIMVGPGTGVINIKSAGESIYSVGEVNIRAGVIEYVGPDYGINVTATGNVTITGNVVSTNATAYAIYTTGGGKVTVNGNVTAVRTGAYIAGTSTTATIAINGNVTVTGSSSTNYVLRCEVSGGGNIIINGNVYSNSCGPFAFGGGNITIDGTMTAGLYPYVRVGNTMKTISNITTPTTKDGFLTYTDGTSTVWVSGRIIAAPPTVVSVGPNGTGVAVNGNVVITFNEAMDTSYGTVQLNSLTALTGGSWSAGDTIFTIPYGGLAHSTLYTVNISGFKNVGGTTMVANSSHSFTTDAASIPLAFTDSPAYDIPASTAGTAITSINVSGGVSGGTPPYLFSATGLPAGITISSAGIISGTPTAAGAADTATITVTDSAGTPDSKSITINYGAISSAAVPPTITTNTLPGGTYNTPYGQNLAATGDATISWDIYSGSLPTGLTLSTAGVISGTPTAAGTFDFAVRATNGAGSDQKSLSMIIAKADQVALVITDPGTMTYGDADFQLATTGGNGTGTITYELVSGPGTVTSGGMVSITGMGSIVVKATKAADSNYNGAASGELTISVAAKDISGATVTISGTYIYSSTAQTPAIGNITVDLVGFTPTYSYAVTTGGTDAGTATVTVTGTGNYTGTATGTFTIAPKDVGGATVTINGTYTYSGAMQTPVAGNVSVTLSGFTPTYTYAVTSGGTNAGSATVTVTGNGNYTGTATGTFIIGPAPLTLTADNKTINVGAAEPVYTYTVSGMISPDTATVITTPPSMTVAGFSNVSANTFTIVITGGATTNPNYVITTWTDGTLTVTAKTDVSSDIVFNPGSKIYTGSEIDCDPATGLTGGTWVYTYTAVTGTLGGNNKPLTAGTYNVTAQFEDDTRIGSKTGTFTITPKDISSATVTISGTYIYSGAAQTPAAGNVSVVLAGFAPTYTYAVTTGGTNAGTATVTVTGTGNFTGTATGTFTIAQKDIGAATVTINGTYTYSGTAQTPAAGDVSVALTGFTPTYSYAVTAGGTNAGTATVTVTGTGNYTGTAIGTFTVAPKDIGSATVTIVGTYTYNGTAQTPAASDVNVILAGFTPAYTYAVTSGGTNAGTATVTVTGTGNYTGTATGTFTIAQKDIGSATVTISGTYTYSGAAQTPAAGNVSVVLAGFAPTYTYAVTSGGTNAGTVTVTVTGTGNYTGTATGTFTIAPKDIGGATVTISGSYTFNGAAQTPAAADISVVLAGFTPTYTYAVTSGGTNVGQATVTVTGTGNYTGTATGTFMIDPAPDTTPPTVLSVAPGGTGVPVSGNVLITFDEAMDITAGIVKLNTLTLSGGSWTVGNTVFTIPYSGLAYSTSFTVEISGFKDVAGNVMTTDSSRSFTTAAAPPPLTFTDSAAYDIPASTVGTAIASINVSGGVSGGTTPYAFSAAGLPDGIVINSTTGVISGTPTTAGPAGTATITVTDGASASQSITIDFGAISSPPQYTITVNNGTADKVTAASGETVTITAGTAPAGQTFDRWTTADGVVFANVNNATTTFVMPAKDVTVNATYKALPPPPPPLYNVTVQNDGNGTAGANVNSAAAGTVITLSSVPNNGYQFKEWQVVSGNVTIVDNKFTMPANAVTVKAVFELTPVAPEYKIIDGADGVWKKGGNNSYAITCNGDIAKFSGIKVDGAFVDPANYDKRSGSTIVSFKSAYLETLSVGVHTVLFVYNDGTADTTLMHIDADSGGTDRNQPPVPSIPGNEIKQSGNNLIEYDAGKNAVGKWKWDDNENAWTFERVSPGDQDDLTQQENNNVLLLLLLGCVLLIAIGGLFMMRAVRKSH